MQKRLNDGGVSSMAVTRMSEESLQTPERALLVAILSQAKNDLRHHGAIEKEESMRFFQNDGRRLELICDLLDLDYRAVQRALKIDRASPPRDFSEHAGASPADTP